MWNNQSFQAHYQKQAERSLNTYQNIMSLIISREGMGVKPLYQIIDHALSLSRYYGRLKLRIPTESYWFRRKGEFQDWFLTDYFAVSLAVSTSTGLQQKAVPNPMWVEEELGRIIKKGMNEIIEKKDWQTTVEILDRWQNSLEFITHNWGIREATHFLNDLEDLIEKQVVASDDYWDKENQDYQDLGMRLSIVDYFQLAHIQIILGFARKLDSFTPDNIGKIIVNLDWVKQKHLYAAEFPQEILGQLEFLQNTLEVEFRAEGHRITPDWYLQQFIAAKFANYVMDVVKEFIQNIENSFVIEAEKLLEEKCSIFAAQTCERGLEALAKAELCLGNTHKFIEQLLVYKKSFGFHLINLPWPEIDWKEMKDHLEKSHDRLVILQGKAIPALMTLPKTKYLPDMFGRAYSNIANRCFIAMVNKRVNTFQELFRAFFITGMSAFQRLMDQLQDRDNRIRLNLSIDPILDIMEISGYAIVYSEFGFGSFWDVVKENWDWYLMDSEKGSSRLDILEACLQYKEDQIGTTPRDMIRITWKQTFGGQMRSMNIEDDLVVRHFGHESNLEKYPLIIQSMIGHSIDSIPLYDLYNVFLAIYFNETSPKPSFKLPRWASDFKKSLENRKKYIDEKGVEDE